MSEYVIEIGAFVVLFLVLKKYWNTKVKEYFGNFVVGINIFVCFLFLYAFINQSLSYEIVFPKILLHGIVATIIYTLFQLDKKKWRNI